MSLSRSPSAGDLSSACRVVKCTSETRPRDFAPHVCQHHGAGLPGGQGQRGEVSRVVPPHLLYGSPEVVSLALGACPPSPALGSTDQHARERPFFSQTKRDR